MVDSTQHPHPASQPTGKPARTRRRSRLLARGVVVTAVGVTFVAFACKHTAPEAATVQSATDAPISSDDMTIFLSGPTLSTVDSSIFPPSDGIALKTFAVDQLAQNLTVGNATTNPQLPSSQYGIWWMDGNPLTDKNLTLANVKFTKDPQGLLVGSFAVYDSGNFVFDGSDGGTKLFQAAKAFKLVYEIHFDQAVQNGTIYPIIHVNLPFGQSLSARIPPSVCHFTMTLRADGLWQRDSFFFGNRVNQYRFTRVINADGTPNHDTSDALAAVTFSDSPTMDLRDPYARYLAFMQNTAKLTTLQVPAKSN